MSCQGALERGFCIDPEPVAPGHRPAVAFGHSALQRSVPFVWGVRDISATRQTLEDQGVPFDGETMTIPGMVSLATFFDPDGNKHMLYEDLSSQDGAP